MGLLSGWFKEHLIGCSSREMNGSILSSMLSDAVPLSGLFVLSCKW